MRKLIWIPVIHNYADMGGSAAEAFNPEAKHYEFVLRVECFWDLVGRELAGLNLDHANLQIYMDSWCEGRTLKDAEMLVLKGSRNFNIIVRYVYRGAILMHTESQDLLMIPMSFIAAVRRRRWEPVWFNNIRRNLVFEYYFWTGRFRFDKVALENIDVRDRYVAERVQKSLVDGGTAILFMGALHNPLQYITAPDIEILHLPKVSEEAQKILKDIEKY